jgi:uncharacterized protein YecE (DUF72 family)
VGHIQVGTASWTDPTLIKSRAFYPKGVSSAEARLRYYASRFELVEVNSSYYALPSLEKTTALFDSLQYALARSRPELFAYQFVLQAEPASA